MEKRIFDYKRIVIIGNGGSGKSFLTRSLADILEYPVLHLDKIFWLPGWEHISREELVRLQKEFISGDRWIIDGNYASSLGIRMKAADLAIYLDVNRLICTHGVISRLKKKRPDMPDYIENKIDAKFVKWIWRFKRDVEPEIFRTHEEYKNTDFLIISGRKALRRFISEAYADNNSSTE